MAFQVFLKSDLLPDELKPVLDNLLGFTLQQVPHATYIHYEYLGEAGLELVLKTRTRPNAHGLDFSPFNYEIEVAVLDEDADDTTCRGLAQAVYDALLADGRSSLLLVRDGEFRVASSR